MRARENWPNLFNLMPQTEKCFLCPRNCGADRRHGKAGYCRTISDFQIASICVHKGEEPVITGNMGICNVFFAHCNMQCSYCQNHQISQNDVTEKHAIWELEEVISKISSFFEAGIQAVGFVSPAQFQPQVIKIIRTLRNSGNNPIFVYNTNGYEKVERIRELEGLIDVYLPDFKYRDASLANRLSNAADYPEVALKSIREMYRQKGSTLVTNDDGYATTGLIIRHLVLPNYIDNSLNVLRAIAEEISSSVHLSLMSQYYPPSGKENSHMPQRILTPQEYEKVVAEAERLGFYRGWFQEPDSYLEYRPDFTLAHPFENKGRN